MIKKLYLHSSNLNYISELRENSSFECVSQYDRTSYEKCHQNEIGRIKTNYHHIHILLGQIRKKGCPFCGCEENPLKHEKISGCVMSLEFYNSYLQCIQCGATSPKIKSERRFIKDENNVKFLEERLKFSFSNVRAWDSDLNLEE